MQLLNPVKPIKLAYLVSHPIQYQAPLLRMLAQQPGIDLTVFYCSKISLNQFTDPEFRTAITWDVPLLEGYKHRFLPALGRDDTLGFLKPFVRGLKCELKRGQFDALWVHGWGRWSHIRAIAIGHRLGLMVLLRGEAGLHLDAPSGVKKWAKDLFVRWLLPKVDRYLAIGSQNRAFYLHCGVDPRKLYDVPYAVDNEFFRKRAEEASRSREELRRSLGLEPGRPVILYAGKLTARKRANDLVEAYRRLSSDGRTEPRAYLLIVGDGELSADLQQRARETGWASIRFMGFKNQTELPRYYDLCDVFVLPSVQEPWGLVINEVMNAGRAVIVSDEVGCGPDLVRQGENGYVFRAGDIADLSRALRDVLADPGKTAAMGRRSSELISRWGFTEDIVGLKQALASVPVTK